MNVTGLVDAGGRRIAKAQIEREPERSPNGGNATNNVRAVDGATVPCIGGGVSSFNPNTSDSATIVGRNGDGFIKKPVEVLDADSFVISPGSDMNFYAKHFANCNEQSFESASIVDND